MPTDDNRATASDDKAPAAQSQLAHDSNRLARSFARNLTGLAVCDILAASGAGLAIAFFIASGGWLLAVAMLPFVAIALYRARHQIAAARRIRAGTIDADGVSLGNGFEHLRGVSPSRCRCARTSSQQRSRRSKPGPAPSRSSCSCS